MPDLKHVNMLLEIARRDLRAADAMKDVAAFPDEVFGFHAQQSVEKALKAWLSLLDIDYPRIHDLDELMLMLAESGCKVDPAIAGLSQLSPFAVQFRYDTLDLSHASLNRTEIISQLSLLVEFVNSLIPRAKS